MTNSTHTHTGRSNIGVVAGMPVTLISDNGRVCKYAPTWAADDVRTAPTFVFHDMFTAVGADPRGARELHRRLSPSPSKATTMRYDLTQDSEVARAYQEARAQGTPDLTSENGDFDDALSNWCASPPSLVVNDGTDEVLALIETPRGPAVAYLNAGWWCAYRVPS